jgi:cobalt-zinc-cadmium efflux system protein
MSAHAHHHGHGHGHVHTHAPATDADRRWLTLALALTVGFLVAEVVAGLLAGSLALLSDAAHMLTDAGSLALALLAARLAARPPSGAFTFGLGRAEILSAQVNGATLLLLGGVIAWEAVQRLGTPPEVDGAVVLAVGALGAAINVAVAAALARSERRSLNLEGARAHVLADLYGSLAAVVAGALVLTTGFAEADGLAALAVAALMLRSAWRLLRASGRVLLEGTPAGLDARAIGGTLAAQPGVVEVHDLHVWEVTSGFPALAAHVLVAAGDDCHGRRRELEGVLRESFGITHTTLQVEHEPAERLLEIERRA